MTIKPFRVPKRVAVCPICGARLWVCDITGCTEQDNGEWVPDEFDIDCETEPDIDSNQWPSWQRGHYRMPYVDWLPVHNSVEAWVQNTYRVIDGVDGWTLAMRVPQLRQADAR